MAPPPAPSAAREQPTVTSRLQRRVEEDVAELYGRLLLPSSRPQQHQQQPPPPPPLPPLPLARRAHARFLRAALGPLPAGFASLDASRCWIVYWAVHGLALLGHDLESGDDDSDAEDDDDGTNPNPSSSSRRMGRHLQRQLVQPRTSSPVKAPKDAKQPPPKAKKKKQKQQPREQGARLRRGTLRRPRSPALFGGGPSRANRPPGGDDGDSSSTESTPQPSELYGDDDDDDGRFAEEASDDAADDAEDDDDPTNNPPSTAAIVRFLRACQSPTGGFGGGPGQRPHLAPTYAAVAALVSLGSERALRSLDRPALRAFLLRCADEARRRTTNADDDSCGFAMHEGGGEIDARSCYTALAAAELAGLDVLELAGASRALRFFARCQTYEGGCGGEPGNEAHGGYGYCAAAACAIVRRAAERAGDEATARAAAAAVDARSALRWGALRQGRVEGGFSGRTNKLADGCYSFWVGAMFPLLQEQVAWLKRRGLWEDGGEGGGGGGRGEGEQQVDALIASVPPLPRSVLEGKTRPPLEAAKAAAALATQRAGDATAAALEAGAAMAGGGDEDEEEEEDPRAAAALDRAARARAAETRALADLKLVERSAARLAASGGGEDEGEGDAAATAAASASAPFPPSLCHPRALALWVLLACQPAAAASASLRRARGASPEPAAATTTKKKGSKAAASAAAAAAGGLRDKPGKPADFYHTCYCLSGLAAATQWRPLQQQEEQEEEEEEQERDRAALVRGEDDDPALRRADPALNVLSSRARAAREFWIKSSALQAPFQQQQPQPADVKMEE